MHISYWCSDILAALVVQYIHTYIYIFKYVQK